MKAWRRSHIAEASESALGRKFDQATREQGMALTPEDFTAIYSA